MLKYVDAKIVFQEIPDEITLAINISNCPCGCSGCHSSYLAADIGTELSINELKELISNNSGISCVAFMGGDINPKEINNLAKYIKNKFKDLKVAWYSGRQILSHDINIRFFDYIKLGPYIEEIGPLNSKITNQRFYRISNEYTLIDETYKFWKNENKN